MLSGVKPIDSTPTISGILECLEHMNFKRLSLARFQRNRAMGFGESAKKWVAEALFFVRSTTHHFCHFPHIDFRQTSHEHVSRWWYATHGVEGT